MNTDPKRLPTRNLTGPSDLSRRSRAKAEAFQPAIQFAQAAGYSDWLAADEAALDYVNSLWQRRCKCETRNIRAGLFTTRIP